MTSAIITISLLSLFLAGQRWGDSSTKLPPLFFVGGLAMILLIAFWMTKLLYWVAAG
jgi:hypothetical protein